VAVIVIEPVYWPAASPVVFTEAVRVLLLAAVEPPAVLRESQLFVGWNATV
jgi:hypothetical protein